MLIWTFYKIHRNVIKCNVTVYEVPVDCWLVRDVVKCVPAIPIPYFWNVCRWYLIQVQDIFSYDIKNALPSWMTLWLRRECSCMGPKYERCYFVKDQQSPIDTNLSIHATFIIEGKREVWCSLSAVMLQLVSRGEWMEQRGIKGLP